VALARIDPVAAAIRRPPGPAPGHRRGAVRRPGFAVMGNHPEAAAGQEREGFGVVGRFWHGSRIRTTARDARGLPAVMRFRSGLGEGCPKLGQLAWPFCGIGDPEGPPVCGYAYRGPRSPPTTPAAAADCASRGRLTRPQDHEATYHVSWRRAPCPTAGGDVQVQFEACSPPRRATVDASICPDVAGRLRPGPHPHLCPGPAAVRRSSSRSPGDTIEPLPDRGS